MTNLKEEIYVGPTFPHPVQAGNVVDYYLVHNKGKRPNQVTVHYDPGTSGDWQELWDLYYEGGMYLGYQVSTTTTNSIKVWIGRIGASERPCRIVAIL